MLQSIIKPVLLVDGNKRLGWFATTVFLHINGIATEHAGNDAVYELVMSVAEGSRAIEAIADDLRQITTGGSGRTGSPLRPPSR